MSEERGLLHRIRDAVSRLAAEVRSELFAVMFVVGLLMFVVVAVAVKIHGEALVRPGLLLALVIGCGVLLWWGYRQMKNGTASTIVVGVVGLLFSLSTAIQSTIMKGAVALAVTAILVLRGRKIAELLKSNPSGIVAALTWSALQAIGTHNVARDLICAGSVLVLLFLLPKLVPLEGLARNSRYEFLATAGMVVLIWGAVSVGDLIGEASGIRQPALRTAERNAPVRVAAALSGGGYRAAIFHAGVLAELEKQGIVVDALATVSGGSIIGSFYATGGDPTEFLSAVKRHEFNLKRELFNIIHLPRVILSARVPLAGTRLLPTNPVTTTTVQASMLDRLYLRWRKFKDVQTRPALMICATDLVNGNAVGITSAGAVVSPILEMSRRLESTAPGLGGVTFTDALPGNERLSNLVAASGAFPGALPPYAILKKPPNPEETAAQKAADEFLGRSASHPLLDDRTVEPAMLLADGGLTDNIGTGLLKHAIALAANEPRLHAFKADVMFASDASALVDRWQTPDSALAEVARAIDTIYLATGESSLPKPSRDIEPILLSASSLVEPRFGSTPRYDVVRDVVKDPAALSAVLAVMPKALQDVIRRKTASTVRTGMFRRDASDVFVSEITDEFDRCLQAFSTFSTLEDQPESEKAEAVYLLGRYVVAVNSSRIRQAMTRASAAARTS